MGLNGLLAATLSFCAFGATAAEASTPWEAKVHPQVLTASREADTEFLVFLEEQARLPTPGRHATRAERGALVVSALQEVAGRTQAPLIELLREEGALYRPYWIANMIWVRGSRGTLERLARLPEVRRIDANPRVANPHPRLESTPSKSGGAVEWNVSQVRADAVWALGYTGQGVVVGGQDTGFEWAHPALRDHYRGWDGLTTDHAYDWHDAIHESDGPCPGDSPAPCDDLGHGTHTLGTLVGDDGGTNRIGVAPGAQWIGCRSMDQGLGTPASYTECFEWFVAPTDADGLDPDPESAPDVINNSWGCPPFEGCSTDTLETVVANTRAAGIFVVVSAGNSGAACSSIETPPALYASSFSVGATDDTDEIALFSSRGPVLVDGSGRLKPDVSAPGVNVRSSVPGDGYATASGTSMAGPHVAGLVALLLSARPDLKGQVDVLEELIERSALPLETNQGCGGDDSTTVPNHTYGFGRVDALALLTGDADADGAANLDDCAPTDPTAANLPAPVLDLILTGGASTELSWSAEEPTYEVLRSEQPDDFAGALCLPPGAGTVADPEIPTGMFAYLVRAVNACGREVAGSSTAPRVAPDCN